MAGQHPPSPHNSSTEPTKGVKRTKGKREEKRISRGTFSASFYKSTTLFARRAWTQNYDLPNGSQEKRSGPIWVLQHRNRVVSTVYSKGVDYLS